MNKNVGGFLGSMVAAGDLVYVVNGTPSNLNDLNAMVEGHQQRVQETELGTIATQAVLEPVDWYMLGKDIQQHGIDEYTLLVLLPLVPAGAMRHVDDLSRAASAPGPGSLTISGHSLTKHGQGARPGNSVFPSATGNPTAINDQAQNIVDEILTDPSSKVIESYRSRFGETIEYISADGRGIVFDANGNFLFFREGN